MTTPDNRASVEAFLAHITDPGYNAAERHAYYLRTRQLKGRKAAAPKSTTSRSSHRAVAKPVVKKSGAQFGKKTAYGRAAAQAQVAAIEGRLGTLRKVLQDLLSQSKEKPKSKDKSSSSSKSSGSNSKRDLTPKQKADQAKRSKEFYDKHKELKPKAEGKTVEEKIKNVRAQIKQMQSELAAAKAKLKRS